MDKDVLEWKNGYDREYGYFLYAIVVRDGEPVGLRVLSDEDGNGVLLHKEAAKTKLEELRKTG